MRSPRSSSPGDAVNSRPASGSSSAATSSAAGSRRAPPATRARRAGASPVWRPRGALTAFGQAANPCCAQRRLRRRATSRGRSSRAPGRARGAALSAAIGYSAMTLSSAGIVDRRRPCPSRGRRVGAVDDAGVGLAQRRPWPAPAARSARATRRCACTRFGKSAPNCLPAAFRRICSGVRADRHLGRADHDPLRAGQVGERLDRDASAVRTTTTGSLHANTDGATHQPRVAQRVHVFAIGGREHVGRRARARSACAAPGCRRR